MQQNKQLMVEFKAPEQNLVKQKEQFYSNTLRFNFKQKCDWGWGEIGLFVYLSSCFNFPNSLSLLAKRISNLLHSSFIVWSCACNFLPSSLDSTSNFVPIASESLN